MSPCNWVFWIWSFIQKFQLPTVGSYRSLIIFEVPQKLDLVTGPWKLRRHYTPNCISLTAHSWSPALKSRVLLKLRIKHCQRHNGPEGWVHLSKVTYWVISQIQTQILFKLHLQNLDQAFTSKSTPNITTSTKLKIQNIDQTLLQHLNQDSSS